MRKMSLVFLTAAAAAVGLGRGADRPDAPDQPVELGRVRWERQIDRALTLARDQERDVLVLFQEVPG